MAAAVSGFQLRASGRINGFSPRRSLLTFLSNFIAIPNAAVVKGATRGGKEGREGWTKGGLVVQTGERSKLELLLLLLLL